MQPRLTVSILVLQAEGLVCAIRYLGFLFQTTPAGIVAEPQQIAVLIGHLARDADLVVVEIGGCRPKRSGCVSGRQTVLTVFVGGFGLDC